MATYYSSDAVEQNGRELRRGERVRSGETAIAVLDNSMWRQATDDIKDAERSIDMCMYMDCRVFAVPNDKLGECADKGREPGTYRQRQGIEPRP